MGCFAFITTFALKNAMLRAHNYWFMHAYGLSHHFVCKLRNV